MAINVTRAGGGGGVGVVDEVVEQSDVKAGRTGNFGAANAKMVHWVRLGAAAVGYLLASGMVVRGMEDVGESIAYAVTPLAAKSLSQPLMSQFFAGQALPSPAAFVPTRARAYAKEVAVPYAPVERIIGNVT